MRLSFNTIPVIPHTGYGNAARLLLEHLEQENVHLIEDAPNILNFCMPTTYDYREFTVGYTPWESTKVPETWNAGLLRVDDLWTTSTWTRDIFRQITGREDIFVLPHGVCDIWLPTHHVRRERPFTFLHVGEPAVRKGGDIVLSAWYKNFQQRDCRLIYKSVGIPMARHKDKYGSILASPSTFDNVTVINQIYSELEMWRLYAEVDALIYPTRGEGFGLIPLEAMASGLPTILPSGGGTGDFSSYGTTLNKYVWRASHEAEHPGLWLDHDVDELIHLMEHMIENYDDECNSQYRNAWLIHSEYDWTTIARKAVDRLLLKVDSR